MGFGRLKRTSAGRGWSSLGPSPSFSPSRSPGLPRCPAVLPGPRCRLHQRPAGLSRKRCRRPAGSGSETSWGSSVRSRAAQPAAASPCPESGSPCALPRHLQPPGPSCSPGVPPGHLAPGRGRVGRRVDVGVDVGVGGGVGVDVGVAGPRAAAEGGRAGARSPASRPARLPACARRCSLESSGGQNFKMCLHGLKSASTGLCSFWKL